MSNINLLGYHINLTILVVVGWFLVRPVLVKSARTENQQQKSQYIGISTFALQKTHEQVCAWNAVNDDHLKHPLSYCLLGFIFTGKFICRAIEPKCDLFCGN